MTKPYLLDRPRGPVAEAEYRLATRAPRIAVAMIVLVTLLVGGLTVLASQTRVPQVIRASGSIMPEGNFVAIETMEGGIVTSVGAIDGDRVSAGSLLVDLHNPNIDREYATLSEQIGAARQSLANSEAVLAAFDGAAPPTLDDVQALRAVGLRPAASTLQVFIESQRIQEGTIAQQRATIDHLDGALSFAEDRVARQREITEQHEALVARGLRPRAAHVAELRQLDQLLADAVEAEIRLSEARNTLAVAQADREQERLTLIRETLTEDQGLRQRLAEFEAAMEVVIARRDDLVLTAPFDGIVQANAALHPGAVIAPGEALFELLPEQQALVVDIRIPSDDIGQITEGQDVALTIDTFDVRQFGRANGRVVTVAPASITDERTGETFFRAFVELDSAFVGEASYQRRLQAGMTTVAEIASGEQTLLAAFLGPIHRTITTAFSESI